jgi:N-acetylneuraminic acid mutarotase
VLNGNRWRRIATLPEPRAAGGLVALEGRLYLVGGVESGDELAAPSYVYNPVKDSWNRRRIVTMPRQHLGAAGARGRVFVVGGRMHGLDTNTGRTDRYSPKARKWTEADEMPTPRGGLAATSSLGFVVAAGGEAEETFDEVEAYDVDKGRWRQLPDMPTARHGLGVVAIGSVIYVLAGGPQPGLTYSDANESLDLAPIR